MDFTDADKVLEALGLFETKKVLEVDFDGPSSVRIIPSIQEPTLTVTGEIGSAQFPVVDFQQGPTITTFRLRGGLQVVRRPRNGLRHDCASYHLGPHQYAAKLALDLGSPNA